MSDSSVLTALLTNTALLMVLVLFFDLITTHRRVEWHWPAQLVAGVVVGFLGVGLIAAAYVVEPGVVFDTRSVLLSMSGLFLGPIPTLVAVGMTGGYRLLLGGAAAWPGVAAIVITGGLGLLWRAYRRKPLADLNWGELYGFGLLVHGLMLGVLGLTLPGEMAARVLRVIGGPVMLIYPLATALLGSVLANRLRRDLAGRALAENEARFRQLVSALPVAVVVTRVPNYLIEFINPKAAEVFGLKPEAAVGRPTLDFYVEKAEARAIRVELERTGRAHRSEIRFQRADGRPFWAELSTVLVTDARGRIALSSIQDISERKEAEAALRRSEQNYREIFNAAHDALFLHDAATGRILDVNEAMLRLYGYADKSEALAVDVEALSANEPPYTPDQALGYIRQAGGGEARVFEWLARRKNGERFWVEISLRSTAIGGAGRVLAVVRDITERKRAEEALRERERQLSTLLSNLPGMAYRCQNDERRSMEFVSDGTFALTGYAPADLVGNRRVAYAELIHPEDRTRVWGEIQHALTQALPFILSYRLIRANGEVCWVWEQGQGVFDSQGRLLALEGLVMDDTARHQAAAELERREAYYRSLIENASDLITVLNQDGVICYQSPSSLRLLGYPPESLLGASLLSYVHPDDAFQVTQAIEQVLSSPTRSAALECRVRNHAGEWRIIGASGRRLPERGNRPLIVVNARDITDQRRLEEQFRQVQKMEAIGRLAGGVAHDFNNILAIIMMQAETTAQLGDLPDRAREGLRQIAAAAERAANLARQLLLFSRRQVIQPRDLDLNAVVTGMDRMLRSALGETIQLELRLHAEPLGIRADPGMIEQVLMNLAVNARDAMPDGGKVVIATTLRNVNEAHVQRHPEATPGRYACLSVTDTGAGIAPEVLPHIFEPFFTTKPTGKGTGLGLATVFGIVRQHRGWIEVDTEVGRGSTFWVYLPWQPQTAAAPRPVAAPALAPARPRRGTETLLVVEDEPAVRALVRTVLERHGYTVLEAANGAEALECWQTQRDRVALVLTDLVMPGGMSGQQLGRQLRQERPHLKVVYLSGYSVEIAGKTPVLQPGELFMGKPFTTDQLLRIVRQALDG